MTQIARGVLLVAALAAAAGCDSSPRSFATPDWRSNPPDEPTVLLSNDEPPYEVVADGREGMSCIFFREPGLASDGFCMPPIDMDVPSGYSYTGRDLNSSYFILVGSPEWTEARIGGDKVAVLNGVAVFPNTSRMSITHIEVSDASGDRTCSREEGGFFLDCG